MKGLYIVTGTSRGIGLAVAIRLLETGNRVIGISRKPSPLTGKDGYRQIEASVTDRAWVEPLFKEVGQTLAGGGFDMLCLLSNAALVDPVGPVQGLDVEAVQRHIDVNLTAPIQLTARFMAHFGALELRKKIVHMTSGAAHHAMPDMAPYCVSKAGVSMFAACLAKEQEGAANGFEVVAISPGMVETDMQKNARAQSADTFRPLQMFRSAKADGVVQDTDTVARKICRILEATSALGETVKVPEWSS